MFVHHILSVSKADLLKKSDCHHNISARNVLTSSFLAAALVVDPLQYLGDLSHQQSSVTEQSANREHDSPLKTVRSSCQS